MEHQWWPNACNDTNEWKLLDLPHNMRNVTDRRLGTLCQNFRSLALTVWEWRRRDTAVSRILRIKHPRLLFIARSEGCDEHSWAQRFIHVQAAVFIHDNLEPWVFFCMLWGWIRVFFQHWHLSVVQFYSLIWTCNAFISWCMSMFKEHQQQMLDIIMK